MQNELRRNVGFNFTVNVLDGSFFGFALGFASFTTIIPLFVAQFTDQTWLIGLISALHLVGWQLPQILTANHVAGLRRYKPMVILMTIHERWPFLGLAFIALFAAELGVAGALALTLVLLTIQALAGGLAATAWQSMIAKLIPPTRRGTFYGTQSSAANLLSSAGAVMAGIILLASGGTLLGFALCFAVSGALIFISFAFIAMNREPDAAPALEERLSPADLRRGIAAILFRDANYRAFIVARMLIQAASIGGSFYALFAVRQFGVDDATTGFMTGAFLIAATIGNPVSGWLGDRYNRRILFALGGLLAGGSALVAMAAPDPSWYYLVFILLGLSNGASWTSANAMTAEFGTDRERPFYIGLVNTLVAPVTLLAPVLGGWLADAFSQGATLGFIAATGLLTFVIAFFVLRDPHPSPRSVMRETTETPALPIAG